MLTRDEREAAEYSGLAITVAAIATLMVPLITLMTAVLLMDGQPYERKRRLLKTWAIASFALTLVLGLPILYVLISLAAEFG
jgi:hypothetical protein